MKTKLSLMLATVVALTGVTVAEPETDTPAVPSVGRGNCDLMASNTVRAVFHRIQQADAQSNEQVAVFEVVENLAHKRVVRYGDGMMPVGMLFTVSMDPNLPGQPSSVVDEIIQMRNGDEAVLKIDHLFLFQEPQGLNIRPCTRLARKPAAVPATPAVPAAPVPGTAQPAAPAVAPRPVTPLIPALPTGNTGSGVIYGS